MSNLFFTILSAFAASSSEKPLAILFYQKEQDPAFNLTDGHAQRRIEELGKVYDVRYQCVDSIFEAEQFTEKTLAGSDKKFAHIEFAAHGTQNELIFKKGVAGGVLSTGDETGWEELKKILEKVDSKGLIVLQSCSTGSRRAMGSNLMERMAKLTTSGQRIIGASGKVNGFAIDDARHFHMIYEQKDRTGSRIEKDVTCIYQKTLMGNIQEVSVDNIDFLFDHVFDRDHDKIELCYELMANLDNREKLQELISRSCPDLPQKIVEHLSNLDIEKNRNTVWGSILNDLERFSAQMGWSQSPELKLLKDDPSRTFSVAATDTGITFFDLGREGEYSSKYKLLLALDKLESYLDLIKLIDNGKKWDENSASEAVRKLTGHVWHPENQSLSVLSENLEIIKKSYELLKSKGDDSLQDWFKKSFAGGCLENRLNSAQEYYLEKKLVTLDPCFDENALYPDDSIGKVVSKSFNSLMKKFLHELKLEKTPSPDDPLFPAYEYYTRESNLIQTIKDRLSNYGLPLDKFSDDELISELQKAGICLEESEIPKATEELSKWMSFNDIKSIKGLFPKNELAELYVKKSLDKVSGILFELGFTVQEAVSFCIDHNLETVDLRAFKNRVTDESIIELADKCPNLKMFALEQSWQVTSASVIKLADKFLDLTTLNLSNCELVTDEFLMELRSKCAGLIDLNLAECKKINGASIMGIIENCPNLTKLNLSECELITDEFLKELPGKCPNLIELNLTGCKKIMSAYPVELADRFLNLTTLNLSSCNQISEESLRGLPDMCPNLTTLNLFGCRQITDESVMKLAENYPNLTTLDLTMCYEITDTSVKNLVEKCINLTRLDLTGCFKLTENCIQSLKTSYPNLIINA